MNFIAEERAKALVKHQTKRKADYAKKIVPIKTGCKQDEPDIVSNFHIFCINIITFLLVFNLNPKLILYCFVFSRTTWSPKCIQIISNG
jgi:hypothetical protein